MSFECSIASDWGKRRRVNKSPHGVKWTDKGIDKQTKNKSIG